MNITISSSDRVMYQVAKLSNDENLIKFFVYNSGLKGSDLFGQFVLVQADSFYLQGPDGFIVQATLNDAVNTLSDDNKTVAEILSTLLTQASAMKDRVIIHEMDGEEELYSLHFEGLAEKFGFSDKRDELTAADAHEIASEVAEETGSVIVWEGSKPSWA